MDDDRDELEDDEDDGEKVTPEDLMRLLVQGIASKLEERSRVSVEDPEEIRITYTDANTGKRVETQLTEEGIAKLEANGLMAAKKQASKVDPRYTGLAIQFSTIYCMLLNMAMQFIAVKDELSYNNCLRFAQIMNGGFAYCLSEEAGPNGKVVEKAKPARSSEEALSDDELEKMWNMQGPPTVQ